MGQRERQLGREGVGYRPLPRVRAHDDHSAAHRAQPGVHVGQQPALAEPGGTGDVEVLPQAVARRTPGGEDGREFALASDQLRGERLL